MQKVKIERIPFTEKNKVVTENYDYIKELITDNDKEILAKLKEAIFFIRKSHGLGYGESIYYKILRLELDFRQINYQNRFPIQIHFDGDMISMFKMKPLLVENRIICDIKALTDKIDFYDIGKIQSYLRALSLHIRIIVNFGKNNLEIRGFRA